MYRRGWLDIPRRAVLKARHQLHEWRDNRRAQVGRRDRTLQLQSVHRRLELLLTAVYGRPIPIAPFENSRWGRVTREGIRRQLWSDAPIAGVDGDTIFLPPALRETDDTSALTRYRLIALEQAERLVRGTTEQALPTDSLERDLYLLREGASIDAQIAQSHRGVADLLHRERGRALEKRPSLDGMTMTEREVESRLRAMLSARPEDLESPSPSPEASLEWARDTARTLRSLGAKYRGLPLTPIWGTLKSRAVMPMSSEDLSPDDDQSLRARSASPESLDSAARSGETPDDSRESGSQETRDAGHAKEGQTKTETPESETPSGRRDEETQYPASAMRAGDGPAAIGPALEHLPPAIHYDEWDADRCTYVKRHAAVRMYDPGTAESRWMRDSIGSYGPTVRRIRHQFERLRSRRSLLRRQRAGDELDVAAYVNSYVDRRAGQSPDDRLYIDARPARRGLAIALLVDASGSTNIRVSESMRIIDIERVALLLASEALDALGDLYAVYSFRGQGPSNVKLSVIKDFAERNGPAVQERIAAIEPEGFTRFGAAIRHATAQLAHQSAGHRLLLILSDGRPHDTDQYQGPYGVEDTRQAVLEARNSGVYPFCLTVDREASEYLPRIFGPTGHTILQQPEQLPKALLGVVQGLIGRH